MSKPISNSAIERSTGASWATWLERLQAADAAGISHKDIVTLLVTNYQITGWWAQALTVRFEQTIGRRRPGQSDAGDYAVSVSKTLDGTVDETLLWWLKKVQSRTDFNGVSIVSSSTTETEKWRHYRVALADGSRMVVGVYAKTPTKASFSLQHSKLASSISAEAWRTYWKSFIATR
jgi:hypothetical protein